MASLTHQKNEIGNQLAKRFEVEQDLLKNISGLEKQILEHQNAQLLAQTENESMVSAVRHQADLKHKQVLSLQSQLDVQTQLLEQAERLKIQFEARGAEIRQLNRELTGKDDEIQQLRLTVAQNLEHMSRQTQEIKAIESNLAKRQ